MANIPLQSLKFPGLPDTYTISSGGGSSISGWSYNNQVLIQDITFTEEAQYVYYDIDFSVYSAIIILADVNASGTWYLGFNNNADYTVTKNGANGYTALAVLFSPNLVFCNVNTNKVSPSASLTETMITGLRYSDTNATGVKLYFTPKFQPNDTLKIYGMPR